jgi:2-polyprenyl-3-methyl-5-hydroxy-6-metoxy-1,4-benzoquinol methylase
VEDDETGFYGKSYWFEHQTDDLGLPDLMTRARTDFLDRYPHWLKLVYDLGFDASRTLEIGCGHGGFVYLLRTLGFEASGLELSPWLADFARARYGVPIYCGPLEEQPIATRSLDLILLFDVIEHLEHPLGFLERCSALLSERGQILLQTPCVPNDSSYSQLREENSPVVQMFLPNEHLFLLTATGLERLLERAGFKGFELHGSVFSRQDITCSARLNATLTSASEHERPNIPPIAQAMIGLFERNRDLHERLTIAQKDADDRLELMNAAEVKLRQLEIEAQGGPFVQYARRQVRFFWSRIARVVKGSHIQKNL